jgi:hypothetical protein
VLLAFAASIVGISFYGSDADHFDRMIYVVGNYELTECADGEFLSIGRCEACCWIDVDIRSKKIKVVYQIPSIRRSKL